MPKPRADSSATIMNSLPASDIILQGYMLKKKRKRLQGMAKRWFRLSTSGQLSYSFHPNSPVRDSVLVSQSFVYANRKQRVFHIDSSRTIMHCRALTEYDFDSWSNALRGFIEKGTQSLTDGINTLSMSAALDGAGGAASMSGAGNGSGNLQDEDEDEGDYASGEAELVKAIDLIARMAAPLHDLESVHLDLAAGVANEGGAPFQSMGSTPLYSASQSPSQKFNKFLKKGSSSREASRAGEQDYFSDAKPTSDALVRQLGQSLALLQTQHRLLAALVPALLNKTGTPPFGRPASLLGNHRITNANRVPFMASSLNASRASSFSFASDNTDEYYEDAQSGMPGGEFFLEDDEDRLQEEEDEDEYAYEEEDDYETRVESLELEDVTQVVDKVPERRVMDENMVVERRKGLPVAASGDEFSMLGMLRKNVGKDLSTISFPVTFNEPLSALQRIAEELEYSDLLHKAATVTDSIERLVLVATFAITGSAGNKFRSSRKPFNPLLGETYECIRPDKGLKFISEKVSHHPPIMAFHAESTTPLASVSTPAWTLDGHIAPSQKFWGMSFELMFPGEFRLTFHDTGDVYDVQKPSSFVKNLVAGTKYLEIVGECIITNMRTSEKAVIDFKEGSSWGGNSGRNKIEGKIMDARGKVQAELTGRWDENVDRKKGGREFQRLWEVNEFPKNPAKYYGFSPFSITLNETTPIELDHLPTSDSRLRPDQLALERGDIDHAEEVKKQVEEKQREKRKLTVGPHVPQHFVATGEGESLTKEWKYKGDYFDKRAAGTLVDVDIF